MIFPDKIIRLRPKDNMHPGFLWYVLQSRHLRLQIEAAARTAVGNYAIGSDDIWNLRMPLPPRDIQRRIVADVEAGRAKIASEREKARTLSTKIEEDIEAYLLGTKKIATD
jgi:restriction endonuclease S subunit